MQEQTNDRQEYQEDMDSQVQSPAGHAVPVEAGAMELPGTLTIPSSARGIVVLTQGLNDVEDTWRQHAAAQIPRYSEQNLATLLVSLFTEQERRLDSATGYFRHNIDIMQQRLIGIADWLLEMPETQNYTIGIFGAGTIGTAALIAAAERPDAIHALALAGSHITEAREVLSRVSCPVLFIAAEKDSTTVQEHQQALALLATDQRKKGSEQIRGTSSLFESENTINQMMRLAVEWFARWLAPIV
ncbi:MAG: hypothetical protein IMW89_16820 [Ktedonobacteraceae bacterium]|nr:hypothetical protein [Ktedonobacteraceae bacterium]